MMGLSEKIKKIRNDNKLTQEQFAEKMLVSRTAVSKWENGTCYPSIDSLKYMSDVFGVSLDELMSNDEMLDNLADVYIISKRYSSRYENVVKFLNTNYNYERYSFEGFTYTKNSIYEDEGFFLYMKNNF